MKTIDSSPCLRSIVMFPCYEDALRMRLGVFVNVCVGRKRRALIEYEKSPRTVILFPFEENVL